MKTDDRATFEDLDEAPADAPAPAPAPALAAEARYELGDVIGRGGMGEVRAATDTRLSREVAVKVLRADGGAARRRFEAEAIINARLQHPGIVPVHDLGELDDGTPFLAMKRVRGRSLRELALAGELGADEARLDVFRKLCDAVAYAHARGVLHLDLKPDNVMVGEFGEVLLMDWGIAAAVDGGSAVPELGPRQAGIAGTPAFMAPEQVEGRVAGPATDVYGLGAVLYELLTDQRPFRGTPAEVLAAVRAGSVRPPRHARPDLRPELARVIEHAMATRPQDRYPSAIALREDIDAFLAHRPLVHVRSTAVERLAKWLDRHRGTVRATTALATLAAVGAALGLWRYSRDVGAARDAAVDAADRARAAEAEAVAGLMSAQIALADTLAAQGRGLEADRHLQEAERLIAGREIDRRALDLARSQLAADSPPPVARCAPHGSSRVIALDLAPDAAFALSWGHDGRLISWDPVGCVERAALTLGERPGPGVVDADGGRAAVLVGDELLLVSLEGGVERRIPAPSGARAVGFDHESVWLRDASATVWVLDPGDERPRALRPTAVGTAYWRPAAGGRLLLADSTRTGGEVGGAWPVDGGPAVFEGGGVSAIDATPDGETILHGDAMGLGRTDRTGGERWFRAGAPTHSLGVAPGGDVVWAMEFDGSVRLLDLDDGRELAAYLGPGDLPTAVAVAERGDALAIAGRDGLVLVYLRPSVPARRPPGAAEVMCQGLALSPDGRLRAIGSDEGDLTLVDVATGRALRSWAGWKHGIRQTSFSPDGRRLAAAARQDGVIVVDLQTGVARAARLPARTVSVAWLDSGLWSVDVEGWLTRVNPDDGTFTRVARGLSSATWGLAAAGADRLLGAAHTGAERGLLLWSAAEGSVVRRMELDETGYHVAGSPDGRLAAVGTHSGQARLYDLGSGALLRAIEADAGPTMGVALSPDGRLLATTGYGRQVKIWDVQTGALLRAVQQHAGPGVIVRFRPDGGAVESCGSDGVSVLPLDAHARHERAVEALGEGGAARAEALAALGWWSRVEAAAGDDEAGRRLIAQARLALGQPPGPAGEDLYTQLLVAAPR